MACPRAGSTTEKEHCRQLRTRDVALALAPKLTAPVQTRKQGGKGTALATDRVARRARDGRLASSRFRTSAPNLLRGRTTPCRSSSRKPVQHPPTFRSAESLWARQTR